MVLKHAKRNYKLETKWPGPMSAKEAKSNLLFFVKDIVNEQQLTVHAQGITPYPVNERHLEASEKLKAQAVHFDSNFSGGHHQ